MANKYLPILSSLLIIILFIASQQQLSVEAHCPKCPSNCKSLPSKNRPYYKEGKKSTDGQGGQI